MQRVACRSKNFLQRTRRWRWIAAVAACFTAVSGDAFAQEQSSFGKWAGQLKTKLVNSVAAESNTKPVTSNQPTDQPMVKAASPAPVVNATQAVAGKMKSPVATTSAPKTIAPKTLPVAATQQAKLAPVLSAADMPRPQRQRDIQTPDISVPPMLPKAPAMPNSNAKLVEKPVQYPATKTPAALHESASATGLSSMLQKMTSKVRQVSGNSHDAAQPVAKLGAPQLMEAPKKIATSAEQQVNVAAEQVAETLAPIVNEVKTEVANTAETAENSQKTPFLLKMVEAPVPAPTQEPAPLVEAAPAPVVVETPVVETPAPTLVVPEPKVIASDVATAPSTPITPEVTATPTATELPPIVAPSSFKVRSLQVQQVESEAEATALLTPQRLAAEHKLQTSNMQFTQAPANESPAVPAAPQAPAKTGPVIRDTPNEPLPDGSPFEVIEEKGKMTVMVRRSKLLRTQVDIYRTAVVDDGVCEVVQFTPREVSIIGKSTGATHITFWFEDANMKPMTYLVTVEPDTEEIRKLEQQYFVLEQMIAEMFPNSKVRLIVAANKLIVKGQARDAEEASQIITLLRSQQQGMFGRNGAGAGTLNEGIAAAVLTDAAQGSANRPNLQIINMLRVPGIQQVALRVKIAELNRTAARNYGIDVSAVANLTTNNNGSKLFVNSLLNSANGNTVPILGQFDGNDISLGLNFLQQQGVVKLLAEPTLVTMSGRPATFVAGGEFAVPTAVGVAGLSAVSTDFRAFGSIISFLPTVVDKDRIRLQVSPEFSQVNTSLAVNNIPGLRTRTANTTVEMREGQTLAIAGLLEDNMSGNTSGNVPFLSRLFGKRSMTRSETELIILVTPELVHPMDPEEVPPLPGFDVTEPTNGQFYLGGAIEGNPTREYRSTVWPRLHKRYGAGGPAMTSGPFGHGQ
jgi:pilus assembly protein CpaC